MKMRNWIMLLIMAAEVFFAVYCFARKSNHVTAGYICAAISLVMLVPTGWLLLFPKVQSAQTGGQYTVAYWQTWYTDGSRQETYASDGSNRELPVAFWYPENAANGKCPVVIFSHGSFGVKESNETLYREMASQGYVVISADHTYQCFKTKLSSGKSVGMSPVYRKEIMSDNPSKNPQKSYERMKGWMKVRTGDINFVLDTFIDAVERDNLEQAVYKAADTKKIFVIGHSLGGSAALGIGRMRSDVAGVISLEAPFMCDIKGVIKDEFIFDETEYPVPVLNIYSDSSWTHLEEWKQYKQNVKYLNADPVKFRNVHIEGIGHMSLTDFSLTSPFLTMCIDGKIAKEKPENSLKHINNICLDFLGGLL